MRREKEKLMQISPGILNVWPNPESKLAVNFPERIARNAHAMRRQHN